MALTKISTDGFKDDAVTNAKIADDAIDTPQIADGAVNTINIADLNVDTGKITDDAVTEDKLANSINTAIAANTAKDLTNLNASNLLTGTVPDARISASSVQQHASSFDDNNIINDISALALKINGIQNATRYNTNSISVDTFQDANGIASLTNMARDTLGGEFIASVIQSYGTDQFWSTTDLDSNRIFMVGGDSLIASAMIDDVTGDINSGQNTAFYISTPSGYNKGFGYELGADSDFGVGFKLTGFQFYNFNTYGRMKRFAIYLASSGGQSGTFYQNNVTFSGDGHNDSSNVIYANNNNSYVGLTLNTPFIVADNTAAFRVMFDGHHNNGNVNSGVAEIQIKGQKLVSTVNNATGNFISNVVNASASTSSMGVVVTYKDAYGTTTLNTDVKVFLSADNGSNFTEVTLVAQPNFATGVKMAKANDVTVTAGTQLKYKVEVANQSANTKVIQITGVSLQF